MNLEKFCWDAIDNIKKRFNEKSFEMFGFEKAIIGDSRNKIKLDFIENFKNKGNSAAVRFINKAQPDQNNGLMNEKDSIEIVSDLKMSAKIENDDEKSNDIFELSSKEERAEDNASYDSNSQTISNSEMKLENIAHDEEKKGNPFSRIKSRLSNFNFRLRPKKSSTGSNNKKSSPKRSDLMSIDNIIEKVESNKSNLKDKNRNEIVEDIHKFTEYLANSLDETLFFQKLYELVC